MHSTYFQAWFVDLMSKIAAKQKNCIRYYKFQRRVNFRHWLCANVRNSNRKEQYFSRKLVRGWKLILNHDASTDNVIKPDQPGTPSFKSFIYGILNWHTKRSGPYVSEPRPSAEERKFHLQKTGRRKESEGASLNQGTDDSRVATVCVCV